MGVTAASLLVRVRADTTDAERQLRNFHNTVDRTAKDATRSFQGMGTSLSAAFGGFTGAFAGGAIMGGLQSMSRMVAGIGQEALSTYAYTERLRMSLSSMAAKEFVQSGAAPDMAAGLQMATKRAQELESWIRKIAIESPFGREDVADAFRMAMAYGFTSEQAQRLTQATIDFSTATGQGGAVMQRVSLALGQIQARGKLSAQELNQLSEAGVNARQILADAFGVSTSAIMEMIEKGLVPASVAVEAVTKDIETNFGGAASRSTESLSGLLNSIEDLKGETLENLFGPSFESAFVPALSRVVELLRDPDFQTGVKTFGEELGKVAGLTLDNVTGSVERIVEAINKPAAISGTGWLEALAGLTGAEVEITPVLGPDLPTIGPIPAIAGVDTVEWNQDDFGKGEYEAEAGVVKVNWESPESGGFAGFEYDAQAGIRKVDWYGGDDFGANTGFRFVYDAEAKVTKIGLGKDEDKLFAFTFTPNWKEGSLVKMTDDALAQMGAAINQSWEATVTMLPDMSEITDALSKPFKAVVEFFTGGNSGANIGTQSPQRQPSSGVTMPWNPGSSSYPIDITPPPPVYVPERARGDKAFRGGWAIVGEEGPELMRLPMGTQIFSNPDTQKMLSMGIPGFADGTTPAPIDPDTLKKAGEAYAAGDVALYKSLMGLTDAVDDNTKAVKGQPSKMEAALQSALGSVPGLFGTSQVTGQQMHMAELGVPQNFADDYLRRLTDEVVNGVDWEGVDIKDAAARAGIDPNLPAEAILEMFRMAWSDSSLFSDPNNLDLINTDAVKANIEKQREQQMGQANIMAMFGLTDENLDGQIEGLGLALASGLNGAIKPENFTGVGETAFGGVATAFTDTELAAGAMTNAATAMASSMSNPSVSQAWKDAGAAAWGSFNEGFGPPAGGTPPDGGTGGGSGVPGLATGGISTGGLTWVGERGPELVDLPYGSKVYSAADSQRMAGGPTVNVYATVRNDLDIQQITWQVRQELKRR